MNDSFLMCRLQRVADLFRNLKRLVDRYRPSLNALRERLAGHEFHHQKLAFTGFFQAVNARDVRMVQRRQHSRFALETRHAVAIVAEGFGKKLDGHTAAQPRVRSLIHVPHTARTQMAGDLVVCEPGSDHDVRRTAGGFYQKPPKSLTYLKADVQQGSQS